MTELSASTGALVQVISGSATSSTPRPRSRPTAPTSGSPTTPATSVTELSASTGALVKVISGSAYGFGDPDAVASDGTHVWVANQAATR